MTFTTDTSPSSATSYRPPLSGLHFHTPEPEASSTFYTQTPQYFSAPNSTTFTPMTGIFNNSNAVTPITPALHDAHSFYTQKNQSQYSPLASHPTVGLGLSIPESLPLMGPTGVFESPPQTIQTSFSNPGTVFSASSSKHTPTNDSPTTIDMPSSESSDENNRYDVVNIDANALLSMDPFDELSSPVVFNEGSASGSESTSQPLDGQHREAKDMLDELDLILFPEDAPKPDEKKKIVKKKSSSSKINKKSLRKSNSFSSGTNNFVNQSMDLLSSSTSTIVLDTPPRKAMPNYLSFNECSKKIFMLASKYSFVYENASSINNDSSSPSSSSLRKTKSSANIFSSYQDRPEEPVPLRNMKAGMIEFQLDLNKRR